MAITVYKSTDGSAPTLNGTVSSLITVLDACLVTGYGAKSAAGWTKPYTGTNLAVFRQATTGGHNGMYLRIDDSGPGAAGAREARLRAYTAMSDVNTGTNPFPTVAQHTNGLFWRKSNTLDAVAQTWIIIADEGTFYFLSQTAYGTGTPEAGDLYYFGSMTSYVSADTNNCILAVKNLENTVTSASKNPGMHCATTNTLTPPTTRYVAARADGTLSAPVICITKSLMSGSATCFGGTTSVITYPNPSNNGIFGEAPLVVEDTASSNTTLNRNIRGSLRGVMSPYSSLGSTVTGDVFQVSGVEYTILRGEVGVCCIQTSGSW